ncbi:MAG: carbohydrate-binding domain-containing protein [Kiritimatiellae bacterium]|nr:carbohydrate-binding domain-containing protein [Kiritimatiellia bacterium]
MSLTCYNSTVRDILSVAILACCVKGVSIADSRPERTAFPFKVSVTSAGEYNTTAVGTDFVLSGTITGNVAIKASETCRVTLSDATLSGTVSVEGDSHLWLLGANTVSTTNASAIAVSGVLTVGGTGSLTATAYPVSKTGVINADGFVLAGGSTSVTVASTDKNACGVYTSGDYTQFAGELIVTAAATTDAKQNGIFLSKAKTACTITGGRLSVTVAGEKGVCVNLDKKTAAMTLSGGVVNLDVAGDGAKGIKGDGSFTMTDGILNAAVSGGTVIEPYEDGDGSNYVVSVTSTSYLSKTGTYVVQDTTPAYAVKCGDIAVSGGTVRVSATGTASRGLCSDGASGTFAISGGQFDITCDGDSSATILGMLDETALTTELDKATASGLRTSGTNSTMTITGGILNIVANGTGGKCIVCKNELVVGTEGQDTLPTDSAFYPDIQTSTYGSQAYVAAAKQTSYKSIGTAKIADLTSGTIYTAASYIRSGSGENVDYTNPKCIKAEGALTMHGGRIRGFSQAEGGEGFESKTVLTINGGLFEATCYDDCINAKTSLVINGGYLYCGSTNNDAIDSNGTGTDAIVINGGVVLAFTAYSPEIGIDVDSPGKLQINGGIVAAFGSNASNMLPTPTGSLSTYRGTVSSSSYAGKYLKMTGTDKSGSSIVTYVKVPAISSSTTLTLLCTTDGCVSTPGITSASSASGTAIGFHGVYK